MASATSHLHDISDVTAHAFLRMFLPLCEYASIAMHSEALENISSVFLRMRVISILCCGSQVSNQYVGCNAYDLGGGVCY